MYTFYAFTALVAATVAHRCIPACSVMQNQQTSLLCIPLVIGSTVAPCLLVFSTAFVILVRWHCSVCAQTNLHTGDCTRFVRFKDPANQQRYAGKRIDMETLYEMYFDEELDFAFPAVIPNLPDSHSASICCLLNDVLCRRNEFVHYKISLRTHLAFLLSKWIPAVLSHSKQQDMSQVRDHYDRSKYYAQKRNELDDTHTPFSSDEAEDDFFGMFLGSTMVYTSGISLETVASANHSQQQSQQQSTRQPAPETLEQMQDAKLRMLCRKLRLARGETHLDIGCGWGTLANYSASKHGTIATGVTLSRNQAAYATAMSKKMRIKDHRTSFWCRDYRDIPTNVGVTYNKISCIEMAEHVGIQNFQKFLLQVRDLLEDDGLFLLQIAGLRRAFQVQLLFGCTCILISIHLIPFVKTQQYEDLVWGMFMAKYIFPGADASMPLNWVVGQLELAGFEVAQTDNIGIHYSITIGKWYHTWVGNRKSIIKTHGERWYRIFHFFLAWSSLIAESGAATCYQILCHKNLNTFDRRKICVPSIHMQ